MLKNMILKVVAILMIFSVICFSYVLYASAYCLNDEHRNVFPVNPICSKCRQHDGVVEHVCTNPDGEDMYCTSCGKRIVRHERASAKAYNDG